MKKATKKLTWLGHNCFLFEFDGAKFLVDPFLPKNSAPVAPENVDADYILVSHAHADHCADAAKIALRCDAPIVAVAEITDYFAKKFGNRGLKTEPLNVGGALYLPISDDSNAPKAQILATPAPHSSTFADNSPGGTSVGFVLSFSQNGAFLSPDKAPIKPLANLLADADAFSIYFACDSALFAEMNWIGKLGLDVAVLPIGDRYTTGPAASLDAVRALKPRFVVPAHYDTWPPIAQNVERWSVAVREYAVPSVPLAIRPGETICEDDDEIWR